MGVTSTNPTSRRGYLSQTELAQFANYSISDATEADDKISQAEEIVDSYVGYQEKFIPQDVTGRCVSAGGNNTLYMELDQQSVYHNDYFVLCEVEIIGGTGAGQRRKVTASDYATGKLTVDSNWTTNPDTTSFFKVYQLGKFPRRSDVHYYSDSSPETYYKSIPEAVKRAVAAQVEYMKSMGDDFFRTDKSEKTSERISTYSYTKEGSGGGAAVMIAPKAKLLLREVLNRVGELI